MPSPSPPPAYAALASPPPPSSSSRRVPLDSPAAAASNAVCTSRYTWWDFAPRFAFESFSKTANLYFLMVGVFQAVPSISPTGGVPTQLFPLAAVVVIDAVFAALEDVRRHRDDARANATTTHVYRAETRTFEPAPWRDVRVGDVLRVANHETLPADAVLLATESAVHGVCYVETKSLDGESNLKRRDAPKPTRQLFVADHHVPRGYVDAELPNADVHQFSGTLHVPHHAPVPLSIQNVLLRGTKLRNADAAYVLVVTTGADCKVLRGNSSSDADAKVSSLDVLVNRQVQIVVVLLTIVCVVGAATDNSALADLKFAAAFVAPDSASKTLFESLAYYLSLLCDLVPITLYVTITIVRAFQSFFMAHDLALYDAASDAPLVVRSMQLNETLGQITHVFADKTGTLTCNDMVLRKCTIGGTTYETLRGLGESSRAFFTHMALCHSVLIEHREEGDEEIEYSAASPDEQALVCGARDHGGVAFVARGAESLTLQVAGAVEVYDVLEVLEFTSSRKRMTVVVQKHRAAENEGEKEDDVLVLTKGSDSVLFQRLAKSDENARVRDATQSQLTAFAHDGLRTLVFASKRLSRDEWHAFHARYMRARSDLRQVEAQAQGLANDIDTLQDELENGLELLGATAIEDRLQDGVPETIAKLRAAGVAVWMLTGDMQETAVNVARACHLVDDHIQCHVIRAYHMEDEDRESILRQLDDVFHTMMARPDDHHAIVIDGASLLSVLREETEQSAAETGDDDDSEQRLVRVALHCRAVIACRVSPLQKAQLVGLVKRHVPDSHTLAIGDGANDVPMLRVAHVGVGIAGQEGRQAVNSSDYAIAQFRFLQPLLLVHGRWNYDRVAGLVGYTFYKNIVYSLSLFWFCMSTSSYSGAQLYSPIIQQFYNLLFTVLPIALFAIQDRDLPSKESALHYPQLYAHDARRSAVFTQRTFWTWVVIAVVDSVALFLLILGASIGVMPHGETAPLTVLWSLGWTMLVAFVTARFCLLVQSWTVIEVGGVLFSLAAMIGVQVLFDSFAWPGEDFNTYSFPWLLERPQLWFGVVLAVAAILLKDVAFGIYMRRFRPQLIDLVREHLRSEEAPLKEKLLVGEDLEIGIDDLERVSLR